MSEMKTRYTVSELKSMKLHRASTFLCAYMLQTYIEIWLMFNEYQLLPPIKTGLKKGSFEDLNAIASKKMKTALFEAIS